MMLQPLMLALLAAIAIPIALHLWTRTRPKRIAWSAQRFLPEPEPAERRTTRLDQPLLLALRIAAVAALAIAAAGPACRGNRTGVESLADIERPVFVVDLSASMLQGERGRRPLDRAAERLDAWWREYGWVDGRVFGCHAGKARLLFDAGTARPGRFTATLMDGAGYGAADLAACVGEVDGAAADQDLIVLSDRSAPSEVPWLEFRSVRWIGMGSQPPNGNAGIAEVSLAIDRDRLRIAGEVTAVAIPVPSSVRLRWTVPERPTVDVPVHDGRFEVELIAPLRTGRLVLELSRQARDAAPWDDLVPLWVPAGNRPRVHLMGPFPPAAEQRILDLLYAAQSRLTLSSDFVELEQGGRAAVVAYHPERLGKAAAARLVGAVQSGATAVLFAGPSQADAGPTAELLPGWVHPAQPTRDGRLAATAEFGRTWQALEGLQLEGASVRRVYPLADPNPEAKVLLETDGGLPVLVRHPVGQGTVYTWLVEPHGRFTSLMRVSAWVPIWLAMLDVLDRERLGAELAIVGAPVPDDATEQRIETAYSGETARQWLGWTRIERARSSGGSLRAVKVPASEIRGGTGTSATVFKAPVEPGPSERPEPLAAESMTLWWLAAALLLWLVQGVGSARVPRVWWLWPFLAVLLFPSGSAHADGQSIPLRIWVPEESEVSAGQIDGVQDAIRAWQVRASPEIASEPVRFAWSITHPEDPWVWWMGCRRFDPGGNEALAANVERYLRAHGTLWIDVCGDADTYATQRNRVGKWLRTRGLASGWRPIEPDHVLFRTFYLLDGWQDPAGVGEVWALKLDGMDRLFLVPNLARSYAQGAGGSRVLPLDGRLQKAALWQGLNLMMYALTYDYKNDAIHLPFILERRQRHR